MHHIARVLALLTIVLIAQPATAETDLDEHNGRFCGAAMNGDWESISEYAAVAEIDILEAFRLAKCTLSAGNTDEYVGNMLHASLRSSPDARNMMIKLTQELLGPQAGQKGRGAFIDLVLGRHVDHDLWHQIRITHENLGRRDNAMFFARIICVSIDRHEITELADVRVNECNTTPFEEPWR